VSTPSTNLLATHANCLPIGTVIADFEIIGLVGEGGFGIVYLAKDVNLDRVVAVKEFMPSAFAGRVEGVRVAVRATNHQATYEAGLRSFINEAKMLAKFAHPSLVEVYRFWEGNGTAYMAMRYYSGETLRQHLARGDMVFDEETIAQTMAPVFDALEMLHREQVYHRDIAPDNIMLADGRPVLLDFGSARRIIGDGTQALTTVLKPGYAPIEQYVDDGTMKQGPWTDVYALGGVLYHLATGKPPMQAVSRLLSDPLQTVQALTGDRFSSVFSEAVSKAMAVRVEDRLQNIQQFSEMLGWTIAKPTRVMTLPSASYARPGDRIEPTLLADSDATVVVSPNVSRQITQNVTQMAAQAAKAAPGHADRSSRPVTEPAAAPVAKKDIKVPLITVGLGVAIIAGYLVMRPAAVESPSVVDKPTAPETKPVLPASTAPVVPAPTETAALVPVVPVATTGLVKLNIVPWGTVVVDGITRGISNSTQLRQLELSIGSHTIEIAKPDSPTFTQTIVVTAESAQSISHTFK
jgi:serine/threonine protein kinase